MRRLVLALLLLLAGGALPLRAQPGRPPAPRAPDVRRQPGDELRVFLLTMGAGDQVWERFGHNALWIRDESRGSNIAYNWGLFDFAQPDFIGRFLTGDTRYWMAGEDALAMISHYADRDRTVWVQELDLTPEQKARLRDFVQWNERPENAYYRYDYYRDNCSTRVRDALDLVLGGQLRRATESVPTGTSYYWHTARLTAGDIPVYTGITLALGQPADRPISAWEEMFIPMQMRQRLAAVRVTDSAGVSRPLVRAERIVYRARRAQEADQPPSYEAYYLAAGLALAALVALLARGAARGGRAARLGFVAVVELWSIIAGVAGVLLVLVYLTRHVYMWHNENMFQLEPLSLLLAALLPLALSRGRAYRAARGLAMAIAAIALAGALLKLLPAFRQPNWDIVALVLPVHLAVAWGVAALGRAAREAATTARGAVRRAA